MRLATVNNVTFAQPAQGMQVVMENPRSGRAVALSDLLRHTFITTRDLDPNDIKSRELSMIHVSKAMASHLLLGNLATNEVTIVNNKANAVDPSVFPPNGTFCSSRSNDQRTRTLAPKWGWTFLIHTKQKQQRGSHASDPSQTCGT